MNTIFVMWFVGLGATSVESFTSLKECKAAVQLRTHSGTAYHFDPVFKQYESGRYVCLPAGHHPWKAGNQS